MATIIARSAESVHWYRKDGAPQYTVKAKDGSDRPTTLRDARKLDLLPSVTTILKLLSKPALEAWKQEQMLLAALTLPRLEKESEKDLVARIVADSKETAKQAAERGTRIHEEVESHFAGTKSDRGWAVEEALFEHFKLHPNNPWLVERAFANELGFGGKVDLYCTPNEFAKYGIVADIKSKEFSNPDDVVAYEEHLMQLAAYRMGLNIPHARCANVFVSVFNPKLIKIIEWSEEDLERGWKMFECLLNFWIIKNKFGA